LIIYFKQRQAKIDALKEFAELNGLSYEQSVAVARPGTLFEHGHSKKAELCVQGALSGLPFSLFNYYYTTGSGKSSNTYDALVMELVLPRQLPHMIIDSAVESFNSTLPITFDRSQKIELEGDFHKYFDLYAPDKYGVTALTLIAPDVMEVLMQYGILCDIEVIGNRLYFYWPSVPRSGNDYERAFSSVTAVLAKTAKKLTTSNVFATASQAQLAVTPGAQAVRLKRTNLLGNVLICGLVGLAFIMFFRAPSAGFVIFQGGIGALVMAAVIYKAIRHGNIERDYYQNYLKRYTGSDEQ
jgi:hypothetical protein